MYISLGVEVAANVSSFPCPALSTGRCGAALLPAGTVPRVRPDLWAQPPALLKAHANKGRHPALWGGRSASARGQPPRQRRRWQSFAFQLFGNENLAGVWHRDLSQPWQL